MLLVVWDFQPSSYRTLIPVDMVVDVITVSGKLHAASTDSSSIRMFPCSSSTLCRCEDDGNKPSDAERANELDPPTQ